MNQKQRDFLIAQIDKQHKAELNALKERRPKEPSLNNYLIAAVLDGSFELRSAEEIRAALVARVRDLGKGDSLVNDASSSSFYRRDSDSDDDKQGTVKLPTDLLFRLPPGYEEVYAAYERDTKAWKEEARLLEASAEAMRIKIQVGSDEALKVLINQADQLCQMSLTQSSQLMLTAGS